MKNLSNPNTLESGALRRIATSPDGQVMIRYLLSNLDSTDEDNRLIRDPVDLNRSQGKALTIKAILEALEAKQ